MTDKDFFVCVNEEFAIPFGFFPDVLTIEIGNGGDSTQSTFKLVLEGLEVISDALHSGVAVGRVDDHSVGILAEHGVFAAGIAVDANNGCLSRGVDTATSTALLENEMTVVTSKSKELDSSDGDATTHQHRRSFQNAEDPLNFIRLWNVSAAIGPVAAIGKTDDTSTVHVPGANEAIIDVGLPRHVVCSMWSYFYPQQN